MKNNEQGRSMIEMLGVLAIIGVLSVGGLAGYAKAMAKYRINKTIDQVTNVVANTRILFGSQRSYKDLSTVNTAAQGQESNAANDTAGINNLIARSKLLPDNMKGETDGDYVNAYGGKFQLRAGSRITSNDNKAFVLAFTGIPAEACIELATQDWSSSAGSGLLAIGINKEATILSNPDDIETLINTDFGPNHCISGAGTQTDNIATGTDTLTYYCATIHSDPITLAQATKACSGDITSGSGANQTTAANNYTTILFKFY